MGWAQRARLAELAEARDVTFVVRRWTAFDWKFPAQTGGAKAAREVRAAMMQGYEDNLHGAAIKMTRKLRVVCPDLMGEVKVVRVKRQPQLLFELQLQAAGKEDAVAQAERVFKRLLSVAITPNRNPRTRPVYRGRSQKLPSQDRTLRPPWGKTEVELI